MENLLKNLMTVPLWLGLACGANAGIIAGYDFTLSSGDKTPEASVVSAGVIVSDIVGVGGADSWSVNTGTGDNTGVAASGTVFGSTSAGSFSGVSDSMTGASLEDAITDGDYITFTIRAEVPGTLDLSGFSIDKAVNTTFVERLANEWNVLAKVDGDASAWSSADALTTDQTTSAPQGLSEFDSTFVDLSATSAFGGKFQDVDSVEFRIYMWGANGTAYSNASRIDQVVVEGTGGEPVFNLAKFQTSSADSASGSTPAQYGNDGFVTQENRWVSSGSGPHWYEVDLAVPMEIGSAHLYSGATSTAAIADLSLQYHDGSGWVDIPGTTVSGNTLQALNLSFATPVTAQQFRLYTTDDTARIKELALYPPTSNGEAVPFGSDLDLNIAKLRQFDYSSVAGANYPALAIDGYVSDDSAWASTNAAGPHSFEVHFPQSEEIRGIHLYSGFEGESGTQMEDFTVDYWSGSAWVTFSGGTVTGNTEEYLSLWFDSAEATNKIRVQTTDSKQAVIRELVVFAENGGDAYPLWTDARHEAPPAKSFLEYEDSYYTIVNRSNGSLLSTSTTGSTVTDEDEPSFQVLLNIGTDTYRLRSKDSERCFEVENASTAAGAAIVEGDYSGMPHQRWRLEEVDDGGYFRIVNVWSGLVLGLDGDNVVQQESGTETSRQWAINYQTHYPKKGQASHFHFNFMFQPGWAYNWKYGDEGEVEYGQYYPMQWGGIASSTAEILRYQPGWYGRANNTVVLGFNEPNLEDQSNMEEETAAYQWPRLQRMRLPLAGPCDSNYKGSWRANFNSMADERGLRTEYEAVHWYSPNGASSGSPSTLINNLEYVYNLYGRKIMLTEFSTRDFDGTKTTWSRNHNYNFLAEFMWRAESLDWLKSWSLFEWGYGGDVDTTDGNGSDLTAMNSPKLALHYNNDKTDPGYEDLMECGLLLAGWDGVAEVLDDKPYIIHNKGRFLRLIDDPASDTVTYADVSHTGQTEQFILVSAASGNKYIVGLSTGRRLSYDGSSVGLADAGTTGSDVEWELNEHQYGWFYIDHPATSKRLRITDANVINVDNDSAAYDNLRFRFIVPAVEFEAADGAEGTVLVGYDFDASSNYPTNPTMTSSSVTATSLTSPMDVSVSTTVGDDSGVDATGVAFGSTAELGCLGIAVSHATTSSFANAVAGDDYVTFTVTPDDGRTLTLSNISFKATKKATTSVDEYAVTDGSGNLIGSPVIIENVVGLTGTYDSVVVDLTGTAYETVTAATEFRIYAWGRGTTSTGGTLAAIDKVVLRGIAGPVLVGYEFDD
ncbi:MAG: glycosyl hydrolase, partial [Verrucomicrobiales bacterium]